MPRLLLVIAVLAAVAIQPNLTTAVTATLAVLVAAAIVNALTSAPAVVPASAATLRCLARRTALLPQLSPDAPGRPRPRAPSVA